MSLTDTLLTAVKTLRDAVGRLTFKSPVAYTYNPLDYAWEAHARYVKKWAGSRKRVIFLGMNPGPFGMAQTGIPFGEVAAVRDWVGIRTPIGKPLREHPRRPVEGFSCRRSEVSGRRLWGLFAQRFGTAESFFAEHFVVNYCPLLFMEVGGRNRTPDKLPARELAPLYAACDTHLHCLVEALQPEWLIGVGAFAATRLSNSFKDRAKRIGCIVHPSPANPASNRDWASTVVGHLHALGVWA